MVSQRVPGATMQAKLHNAYLNLQQRMSAIFDQDLDRSLDGRGQIPGIKQIFEKKEVEFKFIFCVHDLSLHV